MCLLTFLPAGARPDLDALANGAVLNSDGHGFAIVTGDRLLVQRGMDADDMIDAFAQARRRHPVGPALFHSRFGTHGDNGLDNCHPFPVGGDQRTVIAHNGILPKTVQPAKSDPRSDTRIAADEFLPRLGPLRIRRNRRRLERWMGPDNKMVLLTVDRRFTQRAYILNEPAGIWDDGIWYSNDGYQPPARIYRFAIPWWADDGGHGTLVEALDRCPTCYVLNADAGFCHVCGCCLDCAEPAEVCLCYQPARLDTGLATRIHSDARHHLS